MFHIKIIKHDRQSHIWVKVFHSTSQWVALDGSKRSIESFHAVYWVRPSKLKRNKQPWVFCWHHWSLKAYLPQSPPSTSWCWDPQGVQTIDSCSAVPAVHVMNVQPTDPEIGWLGANEKVSGLLPTRNSISQDSTWILISWTVWLSFSKNNNSGRMTPSPTGLSRQCQHRLGFLFDFLLFGPDLNAKLRLEKLWSSCDLTTG